MSRTIAVAVACSAVLLLASAAQAKDKGGGKAVLIPATDLKWTDVKDTPGVSVAAVSGNPDKGAAKMFIKLPAAFSAPLHHHSPDHSVVVVSGTIVMNVDGQDHTLPAGSYFSYTGKKQHTTKCTDAGPCVLYVDSHGKWDIVPEKVAGK